MTAGPNSFGPDKALLDTLGSHIAPGATSECEGDQPGEGNRANERHGAMLRPGAAADGQHSRVSSAEGILGLWQQRGGGRFAKSHHSTSRLTAAKVSRCCCSTGSPRRRSPTTTSSTSSSTVTAWWRWICWDLVALPLRRDAQFTLNEHVDSVVESIRRVGIQTPLTLVGHSLGALISIRLASRVSQAGEAPGNRLAAGVCAKRHPGPIHWTAPRWTPTKSSTTSCATTRSSPRPRRWHFSAFRQSGPYRRVGR